MSLIYLKELKVWHRPQVDCLAAAGVDLIAFETIPSIKEAEAVVELLREFPNSKAWLSFSCKVIAAREQRWRKIHISSLLVTQWLASPSGREAYIGRQPVRWRHAGRREIHAAARCGSQLLSSRRGGVAAGLCWTAARLKHELGGVP